METSFCHCPTRCRKNNKNDLNCFCCLGEKFWFGDIKDSFWTTDEDPSSEKKYVDGYVGLKNLGATCYVNTFLQLWFNNLSFRSTIFDWQLPFGASYNQIVTDDNNGREHIELIFDGDSTTVICGQLQYLFALLLYSTRRYIDPSNFVKSIGLQTDQQQDAQEFSKLFIAMLQDKFASQNNFIIQEQFGGSYCYQTTCSNCLNISRTSSDFFELDLNIQGHSKLRKCLQEFFTEEVLDENNKYFCSFCQSKQVAHRKIVLERLPPVLNLQLLRFVFDRKTGTKKKLNNVIQFPDLLDMNEFMALDDHSEDAIYKLNAVLIHCGMTAHSGHYIAHILDEQKEVWCRFNDEGVEEMKAKTLQLGKEDDADVLTDNTTKKRPKKEDGHSSKNAYMLVYARQNLDIRACDVPNWLKEIVACDNSLFDSWFDKKVKERREAVESGRQKVELITSIYKKLKVNKIDDDYDYISSQWLRNWLNHSQMNTEPCDNKPFLCKHSKIDPNKVTSLKRITTNAADDICNIYGMSPRLKNGDMCSICEKEKSDKESFDMKLNNDLKIISKVQKSKTSPSIGYWVGNQSIRRFKNLAIKSSESSKSQAVNNLNESQTKVEFSFNSDIICHHGNLSLSLTNRKLVSEEIWLICLHYFPNLIPFSQDETVCLLCQKQNEEIKEETVVMKGIIDLQKQQLSFLNKNHSSRCKDFLSNRIGLKLYVIPDDFVDQWRKKIRCGKLLQKEIDNSDLFCDHNKPCYSAEEIIDEALKDDGDVIFITEEEFVALKEFYPITKEVSLFCQENEEIFNVEPLICSDCRLQRLSIEALDSTLYENEPIYVMKTDKEGHDIAMARLQSMNSTPEEEIKSSPKKRKFNLDTEIRKSSRSRTKRGEYMIKVNSDQTLKDLKIQLLSIFSVLPMDQKICFEDGVELMGDDITLLGLGVKPNHHLLLIADEYESNSDAQDTIIHLSGSHRVVEEGFKGTQLLNS